MNGKTLVAYFSASGVTEDVAKKIAGELGAELHEIAPAQPYTAADLDWTNKKSRSTLEMDNENCRPALAQTSFDANGYDNVLIGFPVWWYVEPRIIDTFIESCDLAGKTLVPFATSGGSGIAKCEKHLKSLYPELNWQPGKLVNRGNAADWARGL